MTVPDCRHENPGNLHNWTACRLLVAEQRRPQSEGCDGHQHSSCGDSIAHASPVVFLPTGEMAMSEFRPVTSDD